MERRSRILSVTCPVSGVRGQDVLDSKQKNAPQSSEALKFQRERLEFETVVQPGVLTLPLLGS
jgi:hypothetical protein